MCTRQLAEVACTILLIQTITAQCIGKTPNPWPAPSSNIPVAFSPELNGCSTFAVRSSSPIAPTGVSVHSDRLVIEGPLVIDGELPFLGTVALEGTLPSIGAGSVAHSCGTSIGIAEIVPLAGPLLGTALTPTNLGIDIPSGRACSRIY